MASLPLNEYTGYGGARQDKNRADSTISRSSKPPQPVTDPHAYWSLQSLILQEEEEMEMRTSEHSKPEIALVCDLIPHSIISYQASELHQKRGRPGWLLYLYSD